MYGMLRISCSDLVEGGVIAPKGPPLIGGRRSTVCDARDGEQGTPTHEHACARFTCLHKFSKQYNFQDEIGKKILICRPRLVA